ncbi:MAG: DUF5683 domain-containing protein [Bacteroidota bacterium]
MNRSPLFLFLFLILTGGVFSQVENDSLPPQNPADSLKTDLKEKGIMVEEVTLAQQEINPLAPSKAAFYSAIFPGLGQLYNKRYWKAPIVWGALGVGIYNYSINNTDYNRVRDAFKRRRAGFTDDEFFARNDGTVDPDNPRVSDSGLQDAQESLQRNRDLWLVVTIGFYALNIIDANVDAHLKQYNVSEKLAYSFKPYMDLNTITGDPNLGMALVVKF